MCFTYIPPNELFRISSPTKIVEAMAMGCPVIATKIPDQERIISESGGGIITSFDESDYADAICKLIKDPELAREMGKKGKEYIRKHRSYETLAKNLSDHYFNLLN